MNLSGFFKQEELLAFYHCPEFFRVRNLEKQETEGPSVEGLGSYMESLEQWCQKSIAEEDAQFFGGDDEDSQVSLFSPSLRVLTACFALKAGSGEIEPIFFVRKLPENVRDSHILVICASIYAIRDMGLSSSKAWITTGSQHLPVIPPDQNFEIVERICGMMQAGEYQVKTGRKCTFCPIKDTCEVYTEIERVQGSCANGPSRFYF